MVHEAQTTALLDDIPTLNATGVFDMNTSKCIRRDAILEEECRNLFPLLQSKSEHNSARAESDYAVEGCREYKPMLTEAAEDTHHRVESMPVQIPQVDILCYESNKVNSSSAYGSR